MLFFGAFVSFLGDLSPIMTILLSDVRCCASVIACLESRPEFDKTLPPVYRYILSFYSTAVKFGAAEVKLESLCLASPGCS